jgi:hypothetical protein
MQSYLGRVVIFDDVDGVAVDDKAGARDFGFWRALEERAEVGVGRPFSL